MKLCPLNKARCLGYDTGENTCAWWDDEQAKCCVPVLCERLAGLENFIISRLYGPTAPKPKE